MHQKREHPFGCSLFWYAISRDGARKAVKKTVRWTVFRPWESPGRSPTEYSDVKKEHPFGCSLLLLLIIIMINKESYIKKKSHNDSIKNHHDS